MKKSWENNNRDDVEYNKKATTRFMRQVNCTESCWFWIGPKWGPGYGGFSYKNKTVYAHRAAYKLFVDPNFKISPTDRTKEVIRHACDNRNCVNPKHLVIGTAKDNVDDMRIRGRSSLLNKTYLDTMILPSEHMMLSIFGEIPTIKQEKFYYDMIADKEFQKDKKASWYQT